MKWRETRAEAEWAWLGLHGDGDREDSLLAATLNIFFFQLRLAPKNLVAGFHRFFTAFANNLGISRDRKRKAKRERKWTVWSLCFQVVSLILTRHHFLWSTGSTPPILHGYMSFIQNKNKEKWYKTCLFLARLKAYMSLVEANKIIRVHAGSCTWSQAHTRLSQTNNKYVDKWK